MISAPVLVNANNMLLAGKGHVYYDNVNSIIKHADKRMSASSLLFIHNYVNSSKSINNFSSSPVIVSIVKYASNPYNPKFYDPSPVTIKVGDSIIWLNNDPTIHTVTEGKTDNKNPKEFDSRMLGPNDTFKHCTNL